MQMTNTRPDPHAEPVAPHAVAHRPVRRVEIAPGDLVVIVAASPIGHQVWLARPRRADCPVHRLLISHALLQLSAEHRAVIRRSYYLGRTTAQTADDLQIAEDTVKSRLHCALRALRFTLQEMGIHALSVVGRHRRRSELLPV